MTAPGHIQAPASVRAINDLYYSKGMTDGLPIVPPEPDLVAEFVRASGRDGGEEIGKIAPRWGTATVEKIAINAVMAGCLPEYMPVVVAAVEAISEEAFNLYAVQATTNPVFPAIVVNGPIRGELDVNSGYNCLGQGWRANATIGRALRFVCLNVGGAQPGVLDRATQGNPGKYTFCFAENEEQNPWEPLHVEHGFRREDSTVYVFGGGGLLNIIDSSSTAADLLTTILNSVVSTGTNNMAIGGEAVLVVCPEHAEVLHREGLTKQDIKQILWENARAPFFTFSRDFYFSRIARRHQDQGRHPYSMVTLASTIDHLQIIVAGGAGTHSTYIPTALTPLGVFKPIRRG